MRFVLPTLLASSLVIVAFGLGLYTGYQRAWPVPSLRRLILAFQTGSDGTDQFGRLLHYPGKTEVSCPAQDDATAVLLVAGQSNMANYQGQRYQSVDDRVINFSQGRCYLAASPLLGADGHLGESWTLLGIKLLRSGLYRRVVVIPAAVGGTAVARWAAGGDLAPILTEAIRSATEARFKITAVLWGQGAGDFALHTPEDLYRSGTESVIDEVRSAGVIAPFFITRTSYDVQNWSEDNPIARVQAALVDDKTIFQGPNTDRDVAPLDRFDGYHFSASGQEKFTEAWVQVLRAHPAVVR